MAVLDNFFGDEERTIISLSWLMILSGVVATNILCGGFKAAYGRYGEESFFAKFTISAKTAWFIQELPSLVVPIYALLTNFSNLSFVNFTVLLLFIVHYIQRTLIYPFLIKGGKPSPVHVVAMAFVFCVFNGYLQGFYHAKYAVYERDHYLNIISLIGLLTFILGMAINIHSDHILRNLRKPGETGYKIPIGGMFDYVSGANFFGEIVEWFGFALYAQTVPAAAFAFFTISNIGPRALQHHQWYHSKFENYPTHRRALIPFLL
uniref:3-oxo-5alpha-steroid 4-dehydrogenase (NADP(+)) n=1 Tax=Steinernema glaseri TaxID=37863 RepID=A0A1I8AC16_9BILA